MLDASIVKCPHVVVSASQVSTVFMKERFVRRGFYCKDYMGLPRCIGFVALRIPSVKYLLYLSLFDWLAVMTDSITPQVLLAGVVLLSYELSALRCAFELLLPGERDSQEPTM